MTFLTRWYKDHNTVFCIGTDPSFERLLEENLGRMWRGLSTANPWSMQVVLLEAVVALQDRSVWLVRDVVRNVEKVYSIGRYPSSLANRHQDRLRSTRKHDDFVRLHEAARHTAHCFETLGVSIDTVGALRQEILEACSLQDEQDKSANRATKQIHKNIGAQLRIMQNLHARSQSNKDRLQNEIALVRNKPSAAEAHH